MWDIDVNKSPVPDGYSIHFFKQAWPCISDDICKDVLNFFQTGKLLKQINATNLCLIPKVDQHNDVTQFWSIACCNVLFKIISKMLCSRFKLVLPSLIDEVQSALLKIEWLCITF